MLANTISRDWRLMLTSCNSNDECVILCFLGWTVIVSRWNDGKATAPWFVRGCHDVRGLYDNQVVQGRLWLPGGRQPSPTFQWVPEHQGHCPKSGYELMGPCLQLIWYSGHRKWGWLTTARDSSRPPPITRSSKVARFIIIIIIIFVYCTKSA